MAKMITWFSIFFVFVMIVSAILIYNEPSIVRIVLSSANFLILVTGFIRINEVIKTHEKMHKDKTGFINVDNSKSMKLLRKLEKKK